MTIDISEQQYRLLLKILYWGEWVSNSYKTEIDREGKDVEELEQYLFSFYQQANANDLIMYDEQHQLYFPSPELEEAAHGRLEAYEEYILARDKFN